MEPGFSVNHFLHATNTCSGPGKNRQPPDKTEQCYLAKQLMAQARSNLIYLDLIMVSILLMEEEMDSKAQVG